MTTEITTKRVIDWEAIEDEWRAGIKSVLQIAGEHGISHTAINNRFKKLGVPRDLTAKIRAKADALVSAMEVSASVSTETKSTHVAIISANAAVMATAVMMEREDVRRLRNRASEYEAELEECEDDLAKRVSILKNLADTQKSLIALERQVLKIDDMQLQTSNVAKIELVALVR